MLKSPPPKQYMQLDRSLLRETSLEESIDLTSLGVDIDVEVAGSGGKTGDGLDVGSEGVTERIISMNDKKGV